MAGSKQLTYEIGIDAGDAVGTLKTFSGAVRSAMRDVEAELEDGASAGEKLAAALGQISDRSREEFASAATAAEEMGAALKRAGSSLDVADVLPQLQRLGLTFDEVTADADKLAVALKELDDTKAAGLKDLDATAPGLATKLDTVRDSADQSRSVLANMVGNSVQDLGALGGVAGSAGMAIGQLAEYATEGGISLKNLAGIAGPLIGVGLAVQGISKHFKSLADAKAFDAKQIREFTDAIESGDNALDGLIAKLRAARDIETVGPDWVGGGDDFEEILVRTGVGVEKWAELVAGSNEELQRWAEGARAAGKDTKDVSKIVIQAEEAHENYATAARNAAVADKLFGEAEEEAATSVEDLARAQAEAVQEARDHEVAMLDAAAALNEITSAAAEAERRRGALAGLLDVGDSGLDALGQIHDVQGAIRDLGTFLEEHGVPNIFDPADVNAGPFLDKIAGLRGPIQTAVADAFAAGGPEAAQSVADNYVANLVESLGGALTAEQVRTLLGLDDLEATVRLALDASTAARVRAQLEVLTGVAGTSPLTASIALALEAGTITPEAAEVLVRAQLGQAKVTLPTDVTPPSPEQIAEAGAFAAAQITPIGLPTTADPQGFARGASELAADDYEPATIPIEGDPSDAEREAERFVDETERKTPTVGIDAQTARAAAVILAFLALPRIANVYVDVPNRHAADAVLDAIAAPRKAPIDAFVRSVPSPSEIVSSIGRVRVPVDLVVGQSIRITGIRE